jgi:hypothetical protein
LYGRKQSVIFNGKQSDMLDIKSGVPQGGVGSPDLFNINVKELPKITIFSNCKQFADDTVLYKLIFSKSDTLQLQSDLNDLNKWCSVKNLKLNPNKSVHLRFSFKATKDLPNYTIDSCEIKTKNSHKHLGIFIDNKLNFDEHVEYVVNNCNKKWALLKRLCCYANADVFLLLYKLYILTIVEYCIISYIPNSSQVDKLESIQRSVTKFICFKKGLLGLSYKQRLIELELKPIELRRKLSALKIVFKCIHNRYDVPLSWKNIFTLKNTRNGPILNSLKTRTHFCDKNFFSYTILLFNSLPTFIREDNNLNSFLNYSENFLSNNLRYF